MVLKKDSKVRIKCNFQKLYQDTVIPLIPLRIDELINKLENSIFFSCFDMEKRLFQVLMGERAYLRQLSSLLVVYTSLPAILCV